MSLPLKKIFCLLSFKKLPAFFYACCFLWTFCLSPAILAAQDAGQATKEFKQMFEDFVLPYSYGRISDAAFANSDRVIVNIQDLHCSPEVQKNIAKIIEQFDKNFGVQNVYLEGAFGDIDASWLLAEADAQKNRTLLEAMAATGRLTGAELYSALSGRTDLIKGLEAKEPYLENLQTFGWLAQEKENIAIILESLDDSAASLKNRYYTPRQFKIEKLFSNYQTGKISDRKYFAVLSKHCDKLGLDLQKYPNVFSYFEMIERKKRLNYDALGKQLRGLLRTFEKKLPTQAYKMLADATMNFDDTDKLCGFLSKISRKFQMDLDVNFPELNEYFKYLEANKKINALELISEERKLTEEINARFSETKIQREIVFLTNFNKYIKDFLSGKITASDYEYYAQNIENYKRIYAKYVDNKTLSLLDEYLTRIAKFYEINVDRNRYFAQNLGLEEIPQNLKLQSEFFDASAAENVINSMKGKRVDIMVTGGFHTGGISELLKDSNISYIVITPNVEGGLKEAEETYYKVAKEQGEISFQALANLIASLSKPDQIKLWAAADRNTAVRLFGQTDVDKHAPQTEPEAQTQDEALKRFEAVASQILNADEAPNGDLAQALAKKVKANLKGEFELQNRVDAETIRQVDPHKLKQAFGTIDRRIDKELASIVSNAFNKDNTAAQNIFEAIRFFGTLAARAQDAADDAQVPTVSKTGVINFSQALGGRVLAAVSLPARAAAAAQKFAAGIAAGTRYVNGSWLQNLIGGEAALRAVELEDIVRARTQEIKDAVQDNILDIEKTISKSAKINELLRREGLAQKAWNKLAGKGITFNFAGKDRPKVIFVQGVSSKEDGANVRLNFHGLRVGGERIILIDAAVFNETADEDEAVAVLSELLAHEGTHVENHDNNRFQFGAGQDNVNLFLDEAAAFRKQGRTNLGRFGYTAQELLQIAAGFEAMAQEEVFDEIRSQSGLSDGETLNYRNISIDDDGRISIEVYSEQDSKKTAEIIFDKKGKAAIKTAGRQNKLTLEPQSEQTLKDSFARKLPAANLAANMIDPSAHIAAPAAAAQSASETAAKKGLGFKLKILALSALLALSLVTALQSQRPLPVQTTEQTQTVQTVGYPQAISDAFSQDGWLNPFSARENIERSLELSNDKKHKDAVNKAYARLEKRGVKFIRRFPVLFLQGWDSPNNAMSFPSLGIIVVPAASFDKLSRQERENFLVVKIGHEATHNHNSETGAFKDHVMARLADEHIAYFNTVIAIEITTPQDKKQIEAQTAVAKAFESIINSPAAIERMLKAFRDDTDIKNLYYGDISFSESGNVVIELLYQNKEGGLSYNVEVDAKSGSLVRANVIGNNNTGAFLFVEQDDLNFKPSGAKTPLLNPGDEKLFNDLNELGDSMFPKTFQDYSAAAEYSNNPQIREIVNAIFDRLEQDGLVLPQRPKVLFVEESEHAEAKGARFIVSDGGEMFIIVSKQDFEDGKDGNGNVKYNTENLVWSVAHEAKHIENSYREMTRLEDEAVAMLFSARYEYRYIESEDSITFENDPHKYAAYEGKKGHAFRILVQNWEEVEKDFQKLNPQTKFRDIYYRLVSPAIKMTQEEYEKESETLKLFSDKSLKENEVGVELYYENITILYAVDYKTGEIRIIKQTEADGLTGKPAALAKTPLFLLAFITWFNAKILRRGRSKTSEPETTDGQESKETTYTFYHGTPYDYDEFDISKSKTGEGINKYGEGLYLSRGKRLAPFYANIKSEDAPLHFGNGEKLDNPQPRILEVRGTLNILQVTPLKAREIAKNQEQWEKNNPQYDGIELSDSDQIIIFPKSYDKLSIQSKSTIEEFIRNNPDVNFREWTTDRQKLASIQPEAAALESFKDETGAQQSQNVKLSDDEAVSSKNIGDIVNKNKIIELDISDLGTNWQAIYSRFQRLAVNLSNIETEKGEPMFKDGAAAAEFSFAAIEMLKNAFVHGNQLLASGKIYVYVNPETKKLYVGNKKINAELDQNSKDAKDAKAAGLFGARQAEKDLKAGQYNRYFARDSFATIAEFDINALQTSEDEMIGKISNSADINELLSIVNSQTMPGILKFCAFNRLGKLEYDLSQAGENLFQEAENTIRDYLADNKNIFADSPNRNKKLAAIVAAEAVYLRNKYPSLVLLDFNKIAQIASRTQYDVKGYNNACSTMRFGQNWVNDNFTFFVEIAAHEFAHNVPSENGFPGPGLANKTMDEAFADTMSLLLIADFSMDINLFYEKTKYDKHFNKSAQTYSGWFGEEHDGARAFMQTLINVNGGNLTHAQAFDLSQAILDAILEVAQKFKELPAPKKIGKFILEKPGANIVNASWYFNKILSLWSGIGISMPEFEFDSLPPQEIIKQAVNANKTAQEKNSETQTFYHGGIDEAFNVEDLDVFRPAEKQQKSGRNYAGFYLFGADSRASAQRYASQAGQGKGIGRFEIRADAKIFEFESRGQIERITQKELEELFNQGYDMIKGSNILGKTEYVLLNKNAIMDYSYEKTEQTKQVSADAQAARSAPAALEISEAETKPQTAKTETEKSVPAVAAQTAADAANPAQAVSKAQEIAIQSVLTSADVAAMRNEELNISENLIVFSDYNLDAMRALQEQGFKVAFARQATNANGYSKVMKGVYAMANGDGIIEIIFTQENLGLETASRQLAEDVSDGLKFSEFEGVKRIVITNETTSQDVLNNMKNRFTDSSNAPVKEKVLNLHSVENISNFMQLCQNENRSNDIGIFSISQKQAEKFENAIKQLRHDGIKFVVETQNSNEIKLDGIRLNAKEINYGRLVGKDGILEKLKNLKAQTLALEIDARITIFLSAEVLKELAKDGIDVWKQYGILPVITSENLKDYPFKSEVELTMQDNAKLFLDKDNVSALSAKDSEIFSNPLDRGSLVNLKEALKQAMTAKQKYYKGLKASLNGRFDYTADNISALFALLKSDMTEQSAEDIWAAVEEAVIEAGLSQDARAYVYYLGKERAYEVLGFIRGIAMNGVRQEYKDALKEKGIDLDAETFQKMLGGKYQTAILTLLVKMKMSGQITDEQSLKDLMREEVKGERNYMTAKEFLDAVGAAIHANLDDMIRNNEYEITELKEEEKAGAAEMFKQFNVIIQDRFTKTQTNQRVQVSMNAVRSILAAA